MHPVEVETRVESVVTLSAQARHADALAMLESIGHFLPNSPMLLRLRAENLAALGRTDESAHECEKLMHRLSLMRAAGDDLDDLLDMEQASQLAQLLTEETNRASKLKNALERRQAEAIEKESLQDTVAQLQAKLQHFMSQQESAVDEQKKLEEELQSLRSLEEHRAQELEKAHSELDALKVTLAERESDISDAESELAAREQRVASLENEVMNLQERSANAAESQQQLNEELDRLRSQGDEKTEALNEARRKLSELENMLQEREQAVLEAQLQNIEHEEQLARMQQEMEGVREESVRADQARADLEGELEQLRDNERAKSEDLETARAELSALHDQLGERERAIQEAEERVRENERAMAALKNDFESLQSRAADAQQSEQALAAELAQLRDNESLKSADLEKTRSDMERLRVELEEREARLREESQKNALTTEEAKALQNELLSIRSQANEFADSEKRLMDELDQLRTNERQKSQVLESARSEVDVLRDQLRSQEEAVAAAEEASQEHDAALEALQGELGALRAQAATASQSEEALSQEVAALRENEAAKSEALAAAQAEMDALRQTLLQSEEAAKEAEAVSAQKQQEMDRLQGELAQLKSQAGVAQSAEQGLQQELDQLRRNEEEKNRELEQSRAEMEALKATLAEREEAAARAASEQEESHRIIANLEHELAALRNRNMETAVSQDVLQAEVTQIQEEVKKDADLVSSPQAQQLTQILDQLKEMQKTQFEAQQQARRRAEMMEAQPDSTFGSSLQSVEPLPSPTAGRADVGLEAALSQPSSQRQTQMDALRIAMQQSSRRVPGQGAPAAPGGPAAPRGGNQLDALNAALRQASGKGPATPAAPATRATPATPTTPAAPAAPAGQAAGKPPAPMPAAPARRPKAAPAAADDADEDVVEAYPKPRDTVFVYPDQSVSIAVPSRRRRGKVVVAAVFLAVIALTGVAAFLVLQRPEPAETGGTASPGQEAAQPPEGEEMLTMQFPEEAFGTLYDHNVPHTSDSDWPVFAEAKGLIEFPKGSKFHLVVKKDQAKNLSPLDKLPERSLFSLWLPLLEPTEENLAVLGRMQGLSTMYIDQELDPALMERLRGGVMGKTAINCRQAETMVRDMTPPGERTLTFPAEGIGYIDIRPWQQANESWQRLGSAAGAVTIPAKMEIRLEIAPGRTDLSALAALDIMAVHTLTCEGPDITDVSMDGVAAMRGILCLELSRTTVTNEGFAKIRRNTALEELKLVNTRVTDDGLTVLKNLPQLGRIHFEDAPGVTARSLPLFRELRAMRRLHLGNTGVGGAELAQLARDLPSCAITPK